MKVGFNIVDNESLKSGEVEILTQKMSIIQFLKKINNEKEDIPLDVCVKGLDRLIISSDEPDKISRFIRRILIEKSNFLIRQNLVVQFLMDGELIVIDDASKPKSKIGNSTVSLNQIFGKLERIELHYFYSQLNLSS